MSNPWSLEALRNHLRNSGHGHHDLIPRLVRSVDRSLQLFHFHAYNAKESLGKTVADGDQAKARNLVAVLGGGTAEERQQHAEAKLATEAHIIGTLLIARMVYDQFSQLVDQLTLSPPIGIEKCDLKKVQKQLPAGELKTALDGVLAMDWFRYIDGFCNTAKHRELIAAPLQFSFETETADVRLSEFEYGKVKYPSYTATEVLKGAFDLKNRIVDCGRALNALVVV